MIARSSAASISSRGIPEYWVADTRACAIERWRPESVEAEVITRVYETPWWWLLSRIVSMTLLGVVTGIGLWLPGVPLVFSLAHLASLLSFIPDLGPILSAAAVLMAFANEPRRALWVALLHTGVQIVESFVLAPVIDRKTNYLPPALYIVVLLVLALFVGILGVALATPPTAALVVFVTMLYVQGVLGRRDIDRPARSTAAGT